MSCILVTGGAGYIGSHTCKALRRAGFTVVTYDNLARGNPEAVKWGVLEVGELADGARLRAALVRHRPAAIVHFAALAYVGESNENPAAYYRNNIGGTAELLDAMREYEVCRIVFSSTCAVYGAPKAVPILEESPSAPINPYGATKMICERMLRECAATFSLTFMALRYFNAAGADPDGEIGECHVPETHAIPLLLNAAAGAEENFVIFGDDYPNSGRHLCAGLCARRRSRGCACHGRTSLARWRQERDLQHRHGSWLVGTRTRRDRPQGHDARRSRTNRSAPVWRSPGSRRRRGLRACSARLAPAPRGPR